MRLVQLAQGHAPSLRGGLAISIQAANLYANVSIAGAEKSVGQLQAVSNAVGKTQSTLSKLQANAAQVGKGVGQLAGGLVRVGEYAVAALGAAAVAAEKTTLDFNAQMELIHTQAGAAQEEVAARTRDVLALAHEVGTAPTDLAKGLYHIESVGVRGAQAMDVLKASALGAKTGLASMEDTANALTAVVYSGIGGVKDMTSAMGILDGIVGQGNMRLQDLVDSFGTGILGTAKTFGVGLREVGAALAVLTDAGVKAQPAATRMQMMFTHMAAPVPAAIKVLKDLGLSQFALADDLKKPDGIFVALDDLRKHLLAVGDATVINGKITLTDQGTADVAKLFGGSRFGAAAMQLLQMADRIPQKYELIGQAQDQFAERVKATMDTTMFKAGQFLADLKTGLITFGEGIDAPVGRAIGRLDDMLVAHMDDIRKMGQDAGRAIDGINWGRVESAIGTFVDLLKDAWGILQKIPPELDAIAVGFLGINKLSGGLIGTGLSNIVGGLGKGAANILMAAFSKVPIIGGALGAATATRVFVVNWPSGFGPGGLPGGLNALEEIAAGSTLLTVALSVGTLAALGIAFVSAMQQHYENNYVPADQGGSPNQIIPMGRGFGPDSGHKERTDLYPSQGPRPGDDTAIVDHLAMIEREGIEATKDLDQSTKYAATVFADSARRFGNPDWLKSIEATWTKAGQTMHDKIKEAMSGLSGPNSDAAAAFLGSHLGNAGFGAGGLPQAQEVLTLLKGMPQTKDVVAAEKALEARLPRLQTDATDLANAISIANGNDPKNVKLDKLNGIMADLRAHGDATTRAKVQDLINAVQHLRLHATVNVGLTGSFQAFVRGVSTSIGQTSLVSRYSNVRYEYAEGGHYPAGLPRLTGERGPEWDIPDHSGTIIPAGPSRAISRFLASRFGMGDVKVEVQPQDVRLTLNGRELARARVMNEAFTRRTG